MTGLGVIELVAIVCVLAIPTFIIAPSTASRVAREGENMLTAIARGWWRAGYLSWIIISGVIVLTCLVQGASNGGDGWFLTLFLGPVFLFPVTMLGSFPSAVIGGFIGYNFGAQRRASEALAQSQEQPHPPTE